MLFNKVYKKRNDKYCVSRAKLFTSGDISELNPGPVVTQRSNTNNLIELLQSRLAQHGLRILDVGGAGVSLEWYPIICMVNLAIT